MKRGGANFKVTEIQGTLEPGEECEITVLFCPRRNGSFRYQLPLYLVGINKEPHRYGLL